MNLPMVSATDRMLIYRSPKRYAASIKAWGGFRWDDDMNMDDMAFSFFSVRPVRFGK
jgi:hypothetical protein